VAVNSADHYLCSNGPVGPLFGGRDARRPWGSETDLVPVWGSYDQFGDVKVRGGTGGKVLWGGECTIVYKGGFTGVYKSTDGGEFNRRGENNPLGSSRVGPTLLGEST